MLGRHVSELMFLGTFLTVVLASAAPSAAAQIKDALSHPPDKIIETSASAQNVRDCFVEQRIGTGVTVEYKTGWLATEANLFYVVILPAGSGARIEVHLGPQLMHQAYDGIAEVCLDHLPPAGHLDDAR